MIYTIGSVPYLNAKPLVWSLVTQGRRSPVQVEFAVPSMLPAMLNSGSAQAIMVSSFEALRRPGCRAAKNVCIGSRGKVMSVRVLSKVPPSDIKTLALDRSSMTSNALARIILSERYQAEPECEPMRPDAGAMLLEHDACVLIGDVGMAALTGGLHVLDLGTEWLELTGLPFVWALWVGDEGLTTDLARRLVQAKEEGLKNLDRVVISASSETSFSLETCEHYLGRIMDYHLGNELLQGFEQFRLKLEAHGYLTDSDMPLWV